MSCYLYSALVTRLAEQMQQETRSIVTQMASQIERVSRDQDRKSQDVHDSLERLEKLMTGLDVSNGSWGFFWGIDIHRSDTFVETYVGPAKTHE